MANATSESDHASALLSPARVRTVILIAAIAVTFYLCWMMVRPFLSVITWAAALAILARPVNAWLGRKLGPNSSALISVFLVAAIVVTPTVLVTQNLYVEARTALQALGAQVDSAGLRAQLQQYPILASLLEWIQARLDVEQQIRASGGALAGRISEWLTGSAWFLTQLILTFLTLFYFLRDRTSLLEFVRRFIPLTAEETDDILDRIAQTVNASLYRNLLVKLVQGLLGGLMFWILGLPAPVLCGAATALFAVLPVLGTAMIWAPLAIFLAVSGSWIKAVILALWGSLVVGLIDNFLYPYLVASKLRFHPLTVFFSVFGGLLAFGIAGVVLGPVILAITIALLDIWQTRAAAKITY